jgi:hypothetical protein
MLEIRNFDTNTTRLQSCQGYGQAGHDSELVSRANLIRPGPPLEQ